MPEILVRFMIAVALVLFAVALFHLMNWVILARARKNSQEKQITVNGQFPAILYFTTPECITCRTYQRPQLRRLSTILGKDFPVVEVDATQQPELATQWGVLSVPTTFILDHAGTPRHVNHGAVRAEKLAEQLKQVLEPG